MSLRGGWGKMAGEKKKYGKFLRRYWAHRWSDIRKISYKYEDITQIDRHFTAKQTSYK
jgi:hypothetical protein